MIGSICTDGGGLETIAGSKRGDAGSFRKESRQFLSFFIHWSTVIEESVTCALLSGIQYDAGIDRFNSDRRLQACI
jgi:hypothetical protein